MRQELENYDAAPEEETETDALGSPEADTNDEDGSEAYRQFLADRRTLRYEDTKSNRRKLYDFLLKYSPPLPETSAALYLAFDELRKDNKLELTPLAPERSPDDLTEAEVRQAERAKSDPAPTSSEQETQRAAKEMLAMFRRHQNRPMQRYKNGALVG